MFKKFRNKWNKKVENLASKLIARRRLNVIKEKLHKFSKEEFTEFKKLSKDQQLEKLFPGYLRKLRKFKLNKIKEND